MKLFHQLEENDQQNSISWCMNEIVSDLLDDGVELEPHTDEDKKLKEILEKAVEEAKALPEDDRFEFLVEHKGAGDYIFDISLDLARSSYFADPGDNVIHYEDLRMDDDEDEDGSVEEINNVEDLMTESASSAKKDKHTLN